MLEIELSRIGQLFDGPAVYVGVQAPTAAQSTYALQQLQKVQAMLLDDPSSWTRSLDAIATMPWDFDQLGQHAEARRWARVVLRHALRACASFDQDYARLRSEAARTAWLWHTVRGNPSGAVANIAWVDFDEALAQVRASHSILKPLLLVALARVADGPRGD